MVDREGWKAALLLLILVMPGVGPRAKYWCFTLNNYTPANVDQLSTPIDGVDYIIFGKEVGANGTPHLQGTVCFRKRLRLAQVIRLLGQAHYTVTRCLQSSIDYCKKEGDFTEVGTVPKDGNGKQKESENTEELEAFKNSVKEGVRDLVTLRELHSEIVARYPVFVKDYIRDHRPKVEVTPFPLRPWQQVLYNKLILPPDDRKIIFIVDGTGNQGKSWFARYFTQLHDNSQIVIPGKKADMALVINDEVKTFFFDCPRSKQGDFIQYDFLEELKNGLIFSPKYASKMKFIEKPHVVVLMNEHPDMTKLSADRYSVTVLT